MTAITKTKTLFDCLAGSTVVIEQLDGELVCAQRLRELGIVEGAEVTIIRRSDPLLLVAKETRIAIDLATARRIEVNCE